MKCHLVTSCIGILSFAMMTGSSANADQRSDTAANMALLGQKAQDASVAEWSEYKAQANQREIIGKRDADKKREYITALKTYSALQENYATGNETSLYAAYQKLEATYTAAITIFYPYSPNDIDPHLPLVKVATSHVGVNRIKDDYDTVAHDYIQILNSFSGVSNYAFPLDPPPLPPIKSSDPDYQKITKLEQTMVAARESTIGTINAKKKKAEAKLREGHLWVPDVPLGGLHTHPGQSGPEGLCYRPVGSGPQGLVMAMMPCN